MRKYITFKLTVRDDHEEDMSCSKCGLISIDWGSVEYHLEEEFKYIGADVDVRITPTKKEIKWLEQK